MAIQTAYGRDSATPWTDNMQRDLDTVLNMVLWTDCPLQSLAKRGPKPIARHTEWHVDTITQPSTVTTAIEGGSAPSPTTEAPTILTNGLGHADEGFGVSTIDRMLPTSFGVTDTYGDQAARAYQRLVMQMDYNLLWGEYLAESGAGSRTSGIMEWVGITGASRNAGAAATIASGSVPAAYCSYLTNVGSVITPASLNTNLESFYNGGNNLDDDVCMIGTAMKPVFDALLSTQTVSAATVVPLQRFTRPLDSRMIGATVDYVRTSWGTFTLVVNRWMNNGSLTVNLTGTTYDYTLDGDTDILIFNDDMYQLNWLQAYEEFSRAQTDKSSQGWVEASVTAIYKNPKAFCLLLNVDN